MKAQELTGMKFGELTVLRRVESNNRGEIQWLCECDCGNKKVITANNLRSGNVKSCGCRRKTTLKTHGLSGTRIHRIWKGMKTRCNNPNADNYSYYGGRGIRLCDEWNNDFLNFYSWSMSHGYKDDLTIDRIDPEQDYCPENCQWITSKEQCSNRRSNRYITYNGKNQTIKQWADEYGIDYQTLRNRIDLYNWSIEKAITTPVLIKK